MADSRVTTRFNVVIRLMQTMTLLGISGLIVAARYADVDEHTRIFMSGIALGVIPVLMCMQYILHIEGRRVGHAKHMDSIVKPLIKESARLQRTEELLRISESKLRLVSDAMPSMLIYIDTNWRLRFHNRAYRQWLGIGDNRKIDGLTVSELLGPEAFEQIKDKMEKALAGRRVSYKRTQVMPNGAIYRLRVLYLPHFGPDGKVVGFFSVISDITERRHLADGRTHKAVVMQGSKDSKGNKGDMLNVSDISDHEPTSETITEQLTGWSNPKRRLQQALEHNEFQIHFQQIVPLMPTVPMQSYFKVLLRLQEEEENHVPPGTFIPVAEQFNMTEQIDRWMIRRVAEYHAQSRDSVAGKNNVMYSINLFGSTFSDPQFPEYVAAQLEAHGIPAGVLCFELMAEEIVGRMHEAAAFAAAMREIGCRVMLTCYAADNTVFDHLKALPVQYLRIDADMEREVARDPSLSWLKSLCRVSRAIGVRVIAGQVESGNLRVKLCDAGVDFIQGYGIVSAEQHKAAA